MPALLRRNYIRPLPRYPTFDLLTTHLPLQTPISPQNSKAVSHSSPQDGLCLPHDDLFSIHLILRLHLGNDFVYLYNTNLKVVIQVRVLD